MKKEKEQCEIYFSQFKKQRDSRENAMQNPVALLWRSFSTAVSRAITKRSFKYKENDWEFHVMLEKNGCCAQTYKKKNWSTFSRKRNKIFSRVYESIEKRKKKLTIFFLAGAWLRVKHSCIPRAINFIVSPPMLSGVAHGSPLLRVYLPLYILRFMSHGLFIVRRNRIIIALLY